MEEYEEVKECATFSFKGMQPLRTAGGQRLRGSLQFLKKKANKPGVQKQNTTQFMSEQLLILAASSSIASLSP